MMQATVTAPADGTQVPAAFNWTARSIQVTSDTAAAAQILRNDGLGTIEAQFGPNGSFSANLPVPGSSFFIQSLIATSGSIAVTFSDQTTIPSGIQAPGASQAASANADGNSHVLGPLPFAAAAVIINNNSQSTATLYDAGGNPIASFEPGSQRSVNLTTPGTTFSVKSTIVSTGSIAFQFNEQQLTGAGTAGPSALQNQTILEQIPANGSITIQRLNNTFFQGYITSASAFTIVIAGVDDAGNQFPIINGFVAVLQGSWYSIAISLGRGSGGAYTATGNAFSGYPFPNTLVISKVSGASVAHLDMQLSA